MNKSNLLPFIGVVFIVLKRKYWNVKQRFFPNSFILIILLLFVSNISSGQIIIESSVSPEEMVETILGDGIPYDSVSFQGSNSAVGIFSNGQSTNLGIESGIFLTSGAGYVIPGPNGSCTAGSNNGMVGDSTLTWLAGVPTYDASVLQFDFVPGLDTIRFKYVFGSEEYNEYVFSNFNDVFGFFVSGTDPNGGYYSNKNIALIPGTDNNVSINNVNNGYSSCWVPPTGPCTNCEYYADNTGGMTLEYDGFTTVLEAWIIVIPNETYHIKMAIADAGDHIFDSGVFIKENSVELPEIVLEHFLDPQGYSENMVEGCVSENIIVRLPHTGFSPVTIYYEIAGTAANGYDYEYLPCYITFNAGQDSALIQINPLKDGLLEGNETIELVFIDSLSYIVKYDTLVLTIEDYSDMISVTSPVTLICNGQDVQLEVAVDNGLPPYSFLWEPGGLINDTITVSPDETTTYTVTCTDFCQESIYDSCTVMIVPGDYTEFISFSFLVENNPFLEEDVIGQISEDSIYLVVPYNTGIENLVTNFMIDCASAYVDGIFQYSGVSANDFTNPVTYNVITTDSIEKDWIVIVDILTEMPENFVSNIAILPNPANNLIVVNNAKGYKLSLINGLGTRMIYKELYSNHFTISVENMDSGIYYLQLRNDLDLFSEKIIINH